MEISDRHECHIRSRLTTPLSWTKLSLNRNFCFTCCLFLVFNIIWSKHCFQIICGCTDVLNWFWIFFFFVWFMCCVHEALVNKVNRFYWQHLVYPDRLRGGAASGLVEYLVFWFVWFRFHDQKIYHNTRTRARKVLSFGVGVVVVGLFEEQPEVLV